MQCYSLIICFICFNVFNACRQYAASWLSKFEKVLKAWQKLLIGWGFFFLLDNVIKTQRN